MWLNSTEEWSQSTLNGGTCTNCTTRTDAAQSAFAGSDSDLRILVRAQWFSLINLIYSPLVQPASHPPHALQSDSATRSAWARRNVPVVGPEVRGRPAPDEALGPEVPVGFHDLWMERGLGSVGGGSLRQVEGGCGGGAWVMGRKESKGLPQHADARCRHSSAK